MLIAMLGDMEKALEGQPFPAPAGMTRRRPSLTAGPGTVPRTRGDDPDNGLARLSTAIY